MTTAETPQKPELTSELEKLSYAFGSNIGKNLKMANTEIDFQTLIAGLYSGLTGEDSLMAEKEIVEILQKFQQEQQSKMTAHFEQVKQNGINFLAENKNRPGVVTTENGLQYKVINEGTGAAPLATDKVKVHYAGSTIDGVEFDSSYKRGEPAVFPLNQVIKGWTEGLGLMKVGGKAELYVPSELAYGEKGAHPVILPNSVLIFQVELLGIE